MISKIRFKLYDYFRSGSLLSFIVYYIAGTIYWLFKAGRFYVGTRVVEIPWAILFLRTISTNSNILQFGNVLAYNGVLKDYKVSLIDLDTKEKSRGNLQVYNTDIRKSNLPKESFDAVISVSTIEHVGLWGIEYLGGDRVAMQILYDLLKPKGEIMFTVPFGEYLVADNFRIYDSKKLLELLDSLFDIVCAEYIIWNGWRWVSTPPGIAEKMYFMKHDEDMNCGAALIIARKK